MAQPKTKKEGGPEGLPSGVPRRRDQAAAVSATGVRIR